MFGLLLGLAGCGEPAPAAGPVPAPASTAARGSVATTTVAAMTTVVPTTATAISAPTTTTAPTPVALGSGSAIPEFAIDAGTATSAADLSRDEYAALVGDLEPPWEETVTLEACEEIYPGNYAYRFSIPADAAAEYPAELVVVGMTVLGDVGLPAGARRVTVSGPGEFTTVFSVWRALTGDREGLPAPLVEHLPVFLGSECDAMVIDAGGSSLGRDLFSDGPSPFSRAPVRPVATAPEGTLQHLAETADWAAADHPWRVLAEVHGLGGTGFFADRLQLLADGWTMTTIRENLADGCYAVESGYERAGEQANLIQTENGCPVPDGFEVLHEGDGWKVAGMAPQGSDFADALAWYANAAPRDPAERAELEAHYP